MAQRESPEDKILEHINSLKILLCVFNFGQMERNTPYLFTFWQEMKHCLG